jgi:MOSC domain-containing protein YiiM
MEPEDSLGCGECPKLMLPGLRRKNFVQALAGKFGENLTTEGLLEDSIHIGDLLRVGSAVLQITQPRMPSYKLNVRFDREDMTHS